MSDLATLRIVVDASGAIRVTDQFGKSVEQAGARAAATTTRTTALSTALGTMAGVIGAQVINRVGQLGRDLLTTADQMRVLDGRIRLVTQSQQEFAETQRQLRDLAVATRAPYADTVQLFSRFKLATEELGLAQGELLQFTELLNMAVKNSGSSAAEAQAAMFQLSQGLAAGALRGEEFNSVIEQTPAVARAIAEGLGIPMSQLRRFANEGKLTADAVVSGVLRMETAIRGDFATAPLTIADGWRQFKDAVAQAVGDADARLGASSALGRSLVWMADEVRTLGMTWKVTFAEMEVAALKLTEVLDRRFLSGAQGLLGGALMQLTGGAMGGGLVAGAAGRSAETDAMVAALETYLQGLRAELADRLAGRGAGGGTGSGRRGGLGGGTGAAAFDLDNAEFAQVVGDAIRLLDAEKAAAQQRIDAQARQALLTGEFAEQVGEGRVQVIGFAKAVAEVEDGTDALTESARVFTEQTQLALARFGSNLLKDGLGSLDAFWDDFVQLGRDAIGNVFAKSVMDRIGNDLGQRLAGAVGGLGGTGLGIIGAVGVGLTAGLNRIFGESKWERIAEENRRAAKAMADAAEGMAASMLVSRERWMDDFLNYANDESPLQRELRSLGLRRNELARSAMEIAMGANGSLSNQTMGMLNAGNFSNETAAQIRRDALNFNQTDLGRQALLDFADALEMLNRALKDNQDAATDAARAQQELTLQQFRDSLGVSAMDNLSPVARFAEAQRQYDAIVALARTGDASAVDSLPDTARTLLDAARETFASGLRYQTIFGQVTADVDELLAEVRARRALPQEGFGEATVGTDITNALTAETDRTLAVANATLTVQQQGFTAMVTGLERVVETLEVRLTALSRDVQELG